VTVEEEPTSAAAEVGGAAEPAASPGAGARPEAAGPTRPNRRKVREGHVVSTAMDKTAVVSVVERVRHPRYSKTVQRTKRLYVHDERNEAAVGDLVRVAETRPLSRTKRWRLVEILERAR
jgi:small subunit ribosomal protein S17